jgi:hypothetical protein
MRFIIICCYPYFRVWISRTQQQEYEQGTSPAEQIRVANGEIASLSSFYERQILVSDVVDEVAREVVDTLPEGAYVTSFAYRYSVPVARTRLNDDEGGGKVSISGFVPFREDLSAFRDSIESNPKFSNFSFPPSNWVDAVDIDFSFTFEVKKFTL